MVIKQQSLIDCINGTGDLTATLKFDPIEHIRLRPNIIFDIVDNKKVLHLGCTDHIELIEKKIASGLYLHSQLTHVTSKCLGIDINKEAVEFLKNKGINNIILKDITSPNIMEIKNEKWDYLLMAEVLEHIDDPVLFLKKIISNYKRNIETIIITVPNAFGLVHLHNVLSFGCEVVNSDHRYWFTPYTLWKVINQAGLCVDNLIMCLYENSINILESNRDLLMQKPLLLDTIVAVCHYK